MEEVGSSSSVHNLQVYSFGLLNEVVMLITKLEHALDSARGVLWALPIVTMG